MALQHVGYVELPPHAGEGGFDHAAVHRRMGRVYVAHTANDAVEVIDGATRRHIGSIEGLPAVAGALVSDEHDLVFTANRGDNTVGIFSPAEPEKLTKVDVGIRPNGLAYDATRRRLLAANVGDPAVAGSFTVSLVDVERRALTAAIPMPGRTRWTVFDPVADAFHVNIADPAEIIVLAAGDPVARRRAVPIPSAGPHGLDVDVAKRRVFCACDGQRLVEVDADSGVVQRQLTIAGVPDVTFFNPALTRLYIAIGDPGLIEVVDTASLRRVQTVPTEAGAHTLAFDAASSTVYAFLPATHRAAVYVDVERAGA